jgi:hypothetical protein
VERAEQDAVLADGDGMPLPARQHLDAGAHLLDPRRADEDGLDRLGADAVEVEIGLEALELAAECVAAGPLIGPSRPSRSIALVIVVLSPPGMTRASSPSRSLGARTSTASAPSSSSIRRWAAKSP